MLGFFQGEDKSIQRGEHHYKFGHVESFSYAVGEIVGLVHASYRSVTAHTRHVVYLSGFQTVGRATQARREKKINPKKNLRVDDSNHQSYFNCKSNITKSIFNRLSSCKPFNKSKHF